MATAISTPSFDTTDSELTELFHRLNREDRDGANAAGIEFLFQLLAHFDEAHNALLSGLSPHERITIAIADDRFDVALEELALKGTLLMWANGSLEIASLEHDYSNIPADTNDEVNPDIIIRDAFGYPVPVKIGATRKALIRELKPLLEPMDLPLMRKSPSTDVEIQWLGRNVSVRNSSHPNIDKAKFLLQLLGAKLIA